MRTNYPRWLKKHGILNPQGGIQVPPISIKQSIGTISRVKEHKYRMLKKEIYDDY